MIKTTVLIPARNEASRIGSVIDSIKALPIECEIIVVSNGSVDDTVLEARKRGVQVISEHKRGKGNAIRTGIKYVKTPILIMIDADGTYPVEYIPLMETLLEQYDVVKGSRKQIEHGAMSFSHHFGNWCLSWLASILYWHRITDVCSGLWGFRMQRVNTYRLSSAGFTLEADFFINMIRAKCSYKELPIEYRKRSDQDKAKLMFVDGFKIAWFLIRKRFERIGKKSIIKVDKPWGYELIYPVGKLLYVRKGQRLSEQYHKKKREILYIVRGEAVLNVDGKEYYLEDGANPVGIAPNTIHRLEAKENTVMLELSTSELKDVVRLSDDYGR